MNHHLAQEMQATADALRHIVEQVRFLMQQNHPAVHGDSSDFTVTAYGREVADALDTIASRLDAAAIARNPDQG